MLATTSVPERTKDPKFLLQLWEASHFQRECLQSKGQESLLGHCKEDHRKLKCP